MNFNDLVLGDSLELLIDNRGKNPPYAHTGVPVVSGMSVRSGVLDLSDSKFASTETWQQWMPRRAKGDDVIMTSEAPLGRVAILRNDDPVLIAQRVFGLRGRAGVLDSRFLYYALQTAPVQAELASRATGSTVLGIRQPELRKVRIPAPRFSEQQAIANVLRSLDDKIEANKRVIIAAESLMLTCVSSIRSRVPVVDLAEHSTTSAKPDSFDSVVTHFSLPAFDSAAKPEVVSSNTIKSNKFILSKPSVLFSKLNPRIPRIWDVGVLPQTMSLASTEFVVLVPKEVDSSALWSALAQPEISEALSRKVAGTSGSHQRIRPADLLETPIRDVRELNESAAALVLHLGGICHERRHESSSLVRARNELIPLLMSGKICVRAAQVPAGDVT